MANTPLNMLPQSEASNNLENGLVAGAQIDTKDVEQIGQESGHIESGFTEFIVPQSEKSMLDSIFDQNQDMSKVDRHMMMQQNNSTQQ